MFAEHGVGGIVGLLFNAFFAADYIIGLDGVNTGITGGFLNRNFKLLYIQVAYIVACCAYMFVVTVIIAKGIDMIPGLHLRASEEAELLGMDDDQHGEFAYDYVEVCFPFSIGPRKPSLTCLPQVRRDYLAWTPADKEQKEDGVVPAPAHGIAGHQTLANNTQPTTPAPGTPTSEKKD